MVRPPKAGLEYYPMDVDFIDDSKVIFIEGKCGIEGVEVLRRILDEIYRNGYYTSYDEITSVTLAVRLRCNNNLLSEVVNAALMVGFFSKEQLERNQVLTSRGIQERYIKATERRKGAVIDDIYSLQRSKCIHDVTSTPENAALSTQSKVKESKVDKSKVEGEETPAPEYLYFEFEDPEIENSKEGKLFKTLFQLEGFDGTRKPHKLLGRVPMIKFPTIWLSFDEFKDLVGDFRRSGIPENEYSRPFKLVHRKLKGKSQTEIDDAQVEVWLSDWAKSKTVDDLRREGKLLKN